MKRRAIVLAASVMLTLGVAGPAAADHGLRQHCNEASLPGVVDCDKLPEALPLPG